MKKEFIKKLIISFISGVFIGLVVGIYQFVLSYVSTYANKIISNPTWWVILLNSLLIIGLGFLNFYIIKFNPSIDASGVIDIELSLREDKEIKCKKEIPLMVLNSCISTYSLMPIGSEGPSITLAAKSSALINKIFKVNDKDNILISYGAGFGAALISPLGGLFYSFEEGLHKFNFKLLLRTIVTLIPTTLIIFFLNHHHALAFNGVDIPKSVNILVLISLFISIVLLGFIFLKTLILVKRFFFKFKDKWWVKYRGFILFILAIIFAYTLPQFMGAGDKIIQGSIGYNSLLLILGIFGFRFIITAIYGNGKVSGGLIVPAISLGALIGALNGTIFESLNLISNSSRTFIVLLSMCMFFTFLSKAPLTAITLFLSNIVYSNKSLDIFKPSILIGICMIILIYYLAKVVHALPLYDTLLHEELRLRAKNIKAK